MLNRQKSLLCLLRTAARPVSRFELTKWSFLLRHETASKGGPAFYDFLPYHYGPFSFSLFQELDKLEAMSFVRFDGNDKDVLDNSATTKAPSPSKSVEQDIRKIVSRFATTRRDRLTDYVYKNYPSYTCNSKLKKLRTRPVTKPAVFTAGYEGRSVDAVLNLLVESGITRLIDVRKNPVARRVGFHRSTLGRLCGYLSIEYVHVPALGISSEKRGDLTDLDDYNKLFEDYEKSTLVEEKQAISNIASLVSERPSVLVCMESDPEFCHRTRLAKVVAKRTGLPIRHLGTPYAV